MADEMYDVEDFLAKLSGDRTVKKERGDSNYITKVLMNVRENQGTLIMIPFMNRFKSFYSKLKYVREFQGSTTLIESGSAWYKVLPIEYYPNLTAEQKALYMEVIGYYDTIKDSDKFDYNTIRTRNYSLLYGKALSLTATDGKENKDIEGKACLFMYPSASPIDSLADSIAQKVVTLKGNRAWIPLVLGATNRGRKGALVITFKKGTIGYDSQISFELNGDFNILVDPDTDVLPEDKLSYFNDPIADWLGWMNGKESGNYFNEQAFKELRDNLLVIVKGFMIEAESKKQKESLLVNSNGNLDAMKAETPATTAEGVTQSPAEQPPVTKSEPPF